MIPFADLSRIAKGVAATVQPRERPDVYQAAMERYYRYQPRHFMGAWVMGRSARTDICRRERYQADVGERCVAEAVEATKAESTMDALIEARAKLRELTRHPKALAFLLRYIQARHHSGADRIRAHRYRQELRGV